MPVLFREARQQYIGPTMHRAMLVSVGLVWEGTRYKSRGDINIPVPRLATASTKPGLFISGGERLKYHHRTDDVRCRSEAAWWITAK